MMFTLSTSVTERTRRGEHRRKCPKIISIFTAVALIYAVRSLTNVLRSKSLSPSFFTATPTSVTIPSIKLAGVTSKAGFHAFVPGGVTSTVSTLTSSSPCACLGSFPFAISAISTTRPRTVVASQDGRCSISISRPESIDKSSVVRGAATRTGTPEGGLGEKG